MRIIEQCGLACLLTVPAVVAAHHSSTAIFDGSRSIEVSGTLSEVRWINPHIRIYVDAASSSGATTRWEFESQPPQWYRRVGVSRKLFEDAVGQQVRIAGRPARSGIAFGFLVTMEFEDGTVIEMVTDLVDNQE